MVAPGIKGRLLKKRFPFTLKLIRPASNCRDRLRVVITVIKPSQQCQASFRFSCWWIILASFAVKGDRQTWERRRHCQLKGKRKIEGEENGQMIEIVEIE
jgi:hypothetical protein